MGQKVPLSELVPKTMDTKRARQLLRDSQKFHPTGGRWEFPKKTADRVEQFLIEHKS